MKIANWDAVIEETYTLAIDQGWTVDLVGDGNKLMWKHPDGVTPPVISNVRVSGREVTAFKTRLRKAGLNLNGKLKNREHANVAPQLKVTSATIQNELMTGDDNFDLALSVFLSDSALAVQNFHQAVSDLTDNIVIESLEKDVERLEGELDDARKRHTELEERILLLEQKCSSLGTEVREANDKYTHEYERANKAEGKLRSFRDLFKED